MRLKRSSPKYCSSTRDISDVQVGVKNDWRSPTEPPGQLTLRIYDWCKTLTFAGYTLPVLEYLRRLAMGLGIDPPLIGFFMVKIVGVAIPRPVARGVRSKKNGLHTHFVHESSVLRPRVRYSPSVVRMPPCVCLRARARVCLYVWCGCGCAVGPWCVCVFP